MAHKNASYSLKGWDYSSCGLYFITICTKYKEHFFVKIENGIMIFNEFGKTTEADWLNIETQFPNIETADFVIMPTHLHVILIIDDSRREINSAPISTESDSKIGGITGNKNPMLNRNISTAIRWFRGKTTFNFNKINKKFNWQPRFYNHIIRSQIAFIKIQIYIENNPKMWDRDRNNEKGIKM